MGAMTSATSPNLINADFGLLIAPMWHGEKQSVLVRHEQRCAGTSGRGHVRRPRGAGRVVELKHIDVSVTTAHVQALPGRVVEEINSPPIQAYAVAPVANARSWGLSRCRAKHGAGTTEKT
jgi:hypothetical protein